MITVSKKMLKSKMFEYLRRVEEEGEELVVTDHEIPIVKVIPVRPRRSSADAFADVRGRVKYHADVTEPTTDEWTEV